MFPAASRIAAPAGKAIGPATRIPSRSTSPGCVRVENTSDFELLPFTKAASRIALPIWMGSVGEPVTMTFSLKFSVNVRGALAAYVLFAGAVIDTIAGAIESTLARDAPPSEAAANASFGSSDWRARCTVSRRGRAGRRALRIAATR